jgi:hypothetical protein
MSDSFTQSLYGKGPYGRGKYSRGTGFEDAYIALREPASMRLSADLLPISVNMPAPIIVYTRMRVAGTVIRIGFHVIDQPASVQFSGETLWQKTAVPACMPWWFVGQPASWVATPNSAGAMFP